MITLTRQLRQGASIISSVDVNFDMGSEGKCMRSVHRAARIGWTVTSSE
jgi:hypothetical protein